MGKQRLCSSGSFLDASTLQLADTDTDPLKAGVIWCVLASMSALFL